MAVINGHGQRVGRVGEGNAGAGGVHGAYADFVRTLFEPEDSVEGWVEVKVNWNEDRRTDCEGKGSVRV